MKDRLSWLLIGCAVGAVVAWLIPTIENRILPPQYAILSFTGNSIMWQAPGGTSQANDIDQLILRAGYSVPRNGIGAGAARFVNVISADGWRLVTVDTANDGVIMWFERRGGRR